jgi:hypothetical protein
LIDLKDHVVLVVPFVDRRDLALAKGVVESVVDRLGGDAKPSGGVAVDG